MPRSAADSRSRILAAATMEFADRGFAGAGVDRIARRARLNKAMIYYHFDNKAALYREILRETFQAAGDRVRVIAQGSTTPPQKIRAFIAAIVGEFLARPHFPAIMLREMAEKGRHLDSDTLQQLQTLPRTFHEIVAQGVRSGQFRRIDPMLAYYSFAGPLLFYVASAPVRDQITRLGDINLQATALPEVLAHVATGVLHALQHDPSEQGAQPAATRGSGHAARASPQARRSGTPGRLPKRQRRQS